ncbi:MAG: AmmeMemoRadiSam system protein A [Methylococcaceae bacterium]|jgi:hypothetical protein
MARMLLSKDHEQQLLATAKLAIASGLQYGRPLQAEEIEENQIPAELRQLCASFVTLEINHQLRGCVGNLEANRPLLLDIAQNAYAAAFNDSRFEALQAEEFPQLQIHIALLSAAEQILCHSEDDLIQQLQPYVDGLILQEGLHKATFLPSVWEVLPQPAKFLRQLKQKAGLAPDYWSSTLKVYKYTTDVIS